MVDSTVALSELYDGALQVLAEHRARVGRRFKGRFIQIYLALKYYQNEIPSMYSGRFLSTDALQDMFDDLFAKSSRPLDSCVLSMFEARYLPRTGVRAEGNTYAQNTWRNNLNLQKGIGCYAPASELSSEAFLDSPREACPHLAGGKDGLDGAWCNLNPRGARYRRESHRKWIRIDPYGNGYALIDMHRWQNFAPYVSPQGIKLPSLATVCALYYDAEPGLLLASSGLPTLAQFRSDFNLSMTELSGLFDIHADSPVNRALADTFAVPDEFFSTLLPGDEHDKSDSASPAYAPSDDHHGKATTVTPTANTGWHAEQLVAQALQAEGWETVDMSRQQRGYDLLAKRGRRTCYVEVKSSVSTCTPVLTAKEWLSARTHKDRYILAIIENLNIDTQNEIYWVADPVKTCASTRRTTVAYQIGRSSWTRATVSLADIASQ